MSEYRFMNQLTEKGQTPTPAYVFDLDEMKEFAEKVKRCLTESTDLLCDESKSISDKIDDGDCFFSGSMLTGRISNL